VIFFDDRTPNGRRTRIADGSWRVPGADAARTGPVTCGWEPRG
jgi:hypothetical protein